MRGQTKLGEKVKNENNSLTNTEVVPSEVNNISTTKDSVYIKNIFRDDYNNYIEIN